MSNGFYRAFEERYRGSRELIKSRLRVYLPFVEPLKAIGAQCTAIDLGCGRGEWLELMAEAGIEARGVDLDDGMLAECRSRGLPAERGEAVAFLRALPDDSAAVVSAFHVAEHIPFADLQELVQQALRVLQPAGLLILETPNPENLVVGTSSFFLDPTHERPLPPPLLSFLPEHYGFARTKVLRLQEPAGLAQSATVNLKNVLADVSPDFAVVAQKGGAGPQQMALFDAAFEREYGVELPTLAARYEEGIAGQLAEILSKVDRSAEFEARARDAEQALAGAQQQLAARDANLAARDAEVAGLNARLAELAVHGQQQLAARDAEVAGLNARIAELVAQGQQQLAARDAEIARLNERVAALLSSLSWRLTAPVRGIGAVWLALTGSQPQPGAPPRPWLERLVLHPALAPTIRRSGRWILDHPRLARPIGALLQRSPRLASRLAHIVLAPPARSSVYRRAADSAGATARVRGELTGTDKDLDELMLRIEDEIARWRAEGGA
jgi:O-antigen chain-terminating methyltransferase